MYVSQSTYRHLPLSSSLRQTSQASMIWAKSTWSPPSEFSSEISAPFDLRYALSSEAYRWNTPSSMERHLHSLFLTISLVFIHDHWHHLALPLFIKSHLQPASLAEGFSAMVSLYISLILHNTDRENGAVLSQASRDYQRWFFATRNKENHHFMDEWSYRQ